VNIVTILEQQAALRPDSLAIIDVQHGHSRTTSFGQLRQMSARRATMLAERGLGPGDPVILLQPLSRDFYVDLLAVFRMGAVAVVFDPSAGLEHVERCCEIAKPKALIGSWKAHVLRLACPSIRRIPLKLLANTDAWADIAEYFVAEVDADTAALLTFTSGSTGRPKAAVRTHGFLLEQHRVLSRALTLVPGTRDLTTLPVFVLANLGSGVASVLPDADLRSPRSIDPGPVIDQIRRWNLESTVASPAFLDRLSQSGSPLPSLKRVFVGGGPVFPTLLNRLHAVAPMAELIIVYGSTECEPISMIPRDEISSEDFASTEAGAGLLVGPPVREVSLRILPDRWGQTLPRMEISFFESECLPAGQAGEIVVSGPHVLQGYLHGEGDAATKFKVDGVVWHRTGDCGYLDHRGRLWLVGSASASIRDAHGTLYPLTVEAAASRCANVERAAVVSLSGKRVLAVEWASKPSSADCSALRERVAWAAIDEVCSLPHLPLDRRHNAKVDYQRLVEVLSQARTGSTYA